MANVLKVAALKLRTPVTLIIDIKSYDSSLHKAPLALT